MGLDMYLSAEKYISGYKNTNNEERNLFDLIVRKVGTQKLVCVDAPSVHVKTNVAYWRKVNSVHAWFVRELAGGVDECQEMYVSAEDIKRLVDECSEAVKLYEAGDFDAAQERMEPKSGSFFGGTKIDEWWVEGLRSTIEQLTPLLEPEVSENFSFHYRASW